MFIIKDLKYRAVTFAGQREKIDDFGEYECFSHDFKGRSLGQKFPNTKSNCFRLYYCTIPGSTVPLTDISTVTQSTS